MNRRLLVFGALVLWLILSVLSVFQNYGTYPVLVAACVPFGVCFIGSVIVVIAYKRSPAPGLMARLSPAVCVLLTFFSTLLAVVLFSSFVVSAPRYWPEMHAFLYDSGQQPRSLAGFFRVYSQTPAFIAVGVVYVYCQVCVMIHLYIMAVAPKMRPVFYNVCISWPGTFMFTVSLLAAPVLPILPFIPPPYSSLATLLVLLPALAGIKQSAYNSAWVCVTVDAGSSRAAHALPSVQRVRAVTTRLCEGKSNTSKGARQLRLVQITDPHLGTFMSISRLRAICKEIVRLNPDLVLLTGDYYTPEGDRQPGTLAAAMEPLKAMQGKVFACLGNHDKENPNVGVNVRRDLKEIGATLLVDDGTVVETAVARVQIIGMDFNWSKQEARVQAVCSKFPPLDRGNTPIASDNSTKGTIESEQIDCSEGVATKPSSAEIQATHQVASKIQEEDTTRVPPKHEEEATARVPSKEEATARVPSKEEATARVPSQEEATARVNSQNEKEGSIAAGLPAVGHADKPTLRLILLHDPSAFKHIPPHECALVLSGHTHGGQIGLFSLGLNWTLVGAIGSPDHGLWGHGSNRLYVHRGQGFRSLNGNFVSRLGVPNENSLLCVNL